MEETEAPAGPAPSAAEEFDLSLDDIIKRNRKGQQTNAKTGGNRWRPPPLKNLNAPYSNGRPRFWSWAPRTLQGPTRRFRGGFRKQPRYRWPFWNGAASGARRSTTLGPNGVSPLNRPASAQQSTQVDASSGGSAAGIVAAQQRPPRRAKQFKAARAPRPAQRPFRLNRRPAFLQRQSRFNSRRGQTASNAEGKPSRMRRRLAPPAQSLCLWRAAVLKPKQDSYDQQEKLPATGAAGTTGAKRPFLRGRSPPSKMTRHRQPKGVPLRFNFRAVANQTSLMLNDRFSGLRHKWRFSALRNTDRMVTLP